MSAPINKKEQFEIFYPLEIKSQSVNQIHEEKISSEIFIPGSHKEDSLRDKLLYNLYKKGYLNADGICLNQKGLENLNPLSPLINNEISTFLNQQIEISVSDPENGLTYFSTMTLKLLFKAIQEESPCEIYLVGSYLQEILEKHRFALSELSQLIGENKLIEALLKEKTMISNDVDFRIYPEVFKKAKKPIDKMIEFNQKILHILTKKIWDDPINAILIQDRRESYFNRLKSYLKKSQSISQLVLIDTRKNEKDPIETNTVYSNLTLSNKKNQKPIDLNIILNLKREALFNCDDLKLKISLDEMNNHSLFLENSFDNNIWQTLFDQTLSILHCPDHETCNEISWLRLMKQLAKGYRYFDKDLENELFNKLLLKSLTKTTPKETYTKEELKRAIENDQYVQNFLAFIPKQISSYFEKLKTQDLNIATAFLYHVFVHLKRKDFHPKISESIEKQILALKSSEPINNNLFETVFCLFQNRDLPFHISYGFLHAVLFLRLGTEKTTSCITKIGDNIALQTEEDYFLQTRESIDKAISTFSDFIVQNSSQIDLTFLNDIYFNLLPIKPYQQVIHSALNEAIQHFDSSFESLYEKASKLLLEREPLVQKYGFELLCFSFSYIKQKREAVLKMLFYYPILLKNSQNQEEKLRLTKNLLFVLEAFHFPSLKSTIEHLISNQSIDWNHYLQALISKTELETYSIIFDLWNLSLEQNHEKTTLQLIKKLLLLNGTKALQVFEISLKRNQILDPSHEIFKDLFHSLSRDINQQRELFLSYLTLINQQNDRLKTLEFLLSVDNEISILFNQFSNQQNQLVYLLSKCLEFDYIPKNQNFNFIHLNLKKDDLVKALLLELKSTIENQEIQKGSHLLKELLSFTLEDNQKQSLKVISNEFLSTLKNGQNASILYSFLTNKDFKHLFSNEFCLLINLSTTYLKIAERGGNEPKILFHLLENLNDDSHLKLSLESKKNFSTLILDVLFNLKFQIDLKFKAVLQDKTSLIVSIFETYHDEPFLSDFIRGLECRKIGIEHSSRLISSILNFVNESVNRLKIEKNERKLEEIFNLFEKLEIYRVKKEFPNLPIEKTYQEIFQLFFKENRKDLAAKLIYSLIRKGLEPSYQEFMDWFHSFANEPNKYLIYLEMTESLLVHLKKEVFQPTLKEKLQLISTAFFLPETPLKEKIQFHLMIAEKLLSSENFMIFNHGIIEFDQLLDFYFNEDLKLDILKKPIENLLGSLTQGMTKFEICQQSLIANKVESIFIRFIDNYPQFFFDCDISKILRPLIKTDSEINLFIAGQILIFIISKTDYKIQNAHSELVKLLIDTILKNPNHFKRTSPIEIHKLIKEEMTSTTPIVILWQFILLEKFNIYFDKKIKINVLEKLFSHTFSDLEKSTDLNLLASELNIFIAYFSDFSSCKEIQTKILHQSYRTLICLLKCGNQTLFDLYFHNLLRISQDQEILSKEQVVIEVHLLKDKKLFFDDIALMITEILKTDFENETAVLDAGHFCIKHMTLLMTLFSNLLADKDLPKKTFESLSTYYRLKIIQLIESYRKWSFGFIGPLRNEFISHINQLKNSASIFKIFQNDKKALATLNAFIKADPGLLLENQAFDFKQFMDEAKKLIQDHINTKQALALYRAIIFYEKLQQIQIVYHQNKELKYLIEPNKFLNCFKIIQESILNNPHFDVQLIENNSTNHNFSSKENYIFYTLQEIILKNPHVQSVQRAPVWIQTHLEISKIWCSTLVTLLENNSENEISAILFESYYFFLVQSHDRYTFIDNFSEYTNELIRYFKFFLDAVEVLTADDVPSMSFKLFLDRYPILPLFNIKRNLSSYEANRFDIMKMGICHSIDEMINHLLEQFKNTKIHDITRQIAKNKIEILNQLSIQIKKDQNQSSKKMEQNKKKK